RTRQRVNVVLGATGTNGRGVVRALLGMGERVRAMVRDSSQAAAVAGDRVEVVVGTLQGDTQESPRLGVELVAEGSTMFSSADSLDLFRLVVEQAPDGIIVADQEGVIQIWNSAAAEFFGYLPEEAVGRPLDIIPEHLRHAHWEGFGKAVASGHTK